MTRSFLRVVSAPTPALAIVLVLLLGRGVQLHLDGKLTVATVVDSQGYLDAAEGPLSLESLLSNHRTPVYPLILRAVRQFDRSLSSLPIVHYGVFSGAVVALFLCLRYSGLALWQALLATLPLINCTLIARHTGSIQPESPAVAFGIMSLGLTFLIAAKGTSRRRAVSLAIVSMIAWLTRPAFLFLVVICPVIALLTSTTIRPNLSRRNLMRSTLLTGLATGLPLIAYSTLRLIVVGHFGVVSFGGVNIAGFALNPAVLTATEAENLRDEKHRRFAQAILERRDQLNGASEYGHLPPFSFDEALIRKVSQLEAWSGSYNPTIWDVAVPAIAEELGVSSEHTNNPDWVIVNSELSSLSQTILRKNHEDYASWLAIAMVEGFKNFFRFEKGGRFLVASAVVCLLLWIFFRGLIDQIPFEDFDWVSHLISLIAVVLICKAAVSNVAQNLLQSLKGTVLPVLVPFFAMSLSLVTAIGRTASVALLKREKDGGSLELAWAAACFLYALAGLLLVVLVEPPLERYLIALSPVLPGAVLLLIATIPRRFSLSQEPENE